jgi:glucosamine-6-phosphate isomerase
LVWVEKGVQQMDIKTFDSYDLMCDAIADEIAEQVEKEPDSLICIAAGHTSLGLFKSLIKLYDTGKINLENTKFVAMDEWLGMSTDTPNSCGYFLLRNFFDLLNFKPENIRLFDGTTTDHQEECKSVARFIEKSIRGAIDFLVMGTGMNGHLALNEPGCDFNARVGVVDLDETTKTVAQKYFNEATPLAGGLTLGIKDFSEAKRSILMVSGSHKKGILQKILNDTVSNAVPATAVREFENAALYCDKDAV